jgi:hypothetical protein
LSLLKNKNGISWLNNRSHKNGLAYRKRFNWNFCLTNNRVFIENSKISAQHSLTSKNSEEILEKERKEYITDSSYPLYSSKGFFIGNYKDVHTSLTKSSINGSV